MPAEFYIYEDITRIRLQPMRGIIVVVDNGDDTETVHSWDNLEKESTWRWRPVTEKDRTGADRVAGWVLEVTAYIPYTDYETMHTSLLDLQRKPITEIKVMLKAEDGQEGGAQALVWVTANAAIVRNQSVTWESEKVEYRSRMIVRMRGLYSRDVMESEDPDAWYGQVDGWS